MQFFDTAACGNISITTAAVTANSAGAGNAISAIANTTTGDITVVANGVLTADNAAVQAALLDGTATGDINVTTNAAIKAYFITVSGSGLQRRSLSHIAVVPRTEMAAATDFAW